MISNEILKSQLDEANIRLQQLDNRFNSLEQKTSDLVETFEALKGLWKIMQWLASFVKIVGSLSVFGVSIWWLKDHVKDLFK
jgi:hypothetical protein